MSNIGPVVNNLVLPVSHRGRSGFLGVSQRFTGAQAAYFTSVSREFIANAGGVPSDWPKSQGGKILLGYYKDPRVAAYVLAYWTANPVALINRFNSIVVNANTRTRRYQVEWENALLPNIPQELYAVSDDYAQLMLNYPAAKAAPRSTTTTVRVVNTMIDWSRLLRDYSVTGEAIFRALGGTPADQAFVLSLRTLSYDDAKAALARRGLDLDLDGVQRVGALA